MKSESFKWLNIEEYPFVSNYFNLNNTRLHYIDIGEGEPVLFVHGTPSWSFDFRNIIKQLSKQYRCIAIDHIGFGLSGKPVGYDYSTQNHCSTLALFIAHLGLKDITMVMHDFGGPIGFNYALNNPANIKRLVVLNSWLWNNSDDSAFIKIKKLLKSPLLPLLYRYFNFSARYLLPASFGEQKLNRALLPQYTNPFSKRSERNGPIAFAVSLIKDQHWFEGLWNRKSLLKHKPMLLVWGMADRFTNSSYLDKFMGGFSNTYIKKLDSCGHFPQEECADEVTRSIKYFLAKDSLYATAQK